MSIAWPGAGLPRRPFMTAATRGAASLPNQEKIGPPECPPSMSKVLIMLVALMTLPFGMRKSLVRNSTMAGRLSGPW